MTPSFLSIPTPTQRECKLALTGWGAYLSYSMTYCLAHQAYIENNPVNISDAVTWAINEWGIWLLLTPALFYFFRQATTTTRLLLVATTGLAAGLVFQALSIGNSSPTALTAGMVYYFQQYLVATVITLTAWLLLLKPKSHSIPWQKRPNAQQTLIEEPTIAAHQAPKGKLETPDLLLVNKGKDECVIDIASIDSISAAGNYVEIYCGQSQYILRSSLKDMANKLPAGRFLQTHRSHIVRLACIDRIQIQPSGNAVVVLQSGRCVNLSKAKRQALKHHQATTEMPIDTVNWVA